MTYPIVSRPEACYFIKKETLAQVFSCKFCEIAKNTSLYRTPLAIASGRFSEILNKILADFFTFYRNLNPTHEGKLNYYHQKVHIRGAL